MSKTEHQRDGSGHAQNAAGCETADLEMGAETPLLQPSRCRAARNINLDQMWPVHRAGGWPESLSLRREDLYEGRT